MAPFMKASPEGKTTINWQRVFELLIIVAFNAIVLVTTMQLKIKFIENTVQRLESIITTNDHRLDNAESNLAVCMDRLNHARSRQ